ncbi:Hypothetical protein, putative [Bodo saltans]|uniref:Macro domain-containing protein n=1 Tax=Bodo saltans TaxID=75058 RepID=A0A0S4JB14_BODSA|nr:Hypothetical protein, putative [Bodo saltans]|eukprot:CUG87200.1 Hypothetical protein, putative [Bodo saltans]
MSTSGDSRQDSNVTIESDEGAPTSMGLRAKTSAPTAVVERTNTLLQRQQLDGGMGARAHTETALDNVPPYHPEQINYDLHLPAEDDGGSGRRAKDEAQVDRYRLRTLKLPFDDPKEQQMFDMSFEQWRSIDRSSFGWRCRVPPPIKEIEDIEPWAKDDIHILDKIALVRCGVTQLALDAIVNAANEECLGGGGVDGAIHSAAGGLLRRECSTFNGCRTGHTRMTKGYHLPAKFILHTVGPMGERPTLLRSCYRSCLELAKHHSLRTVGFCCISTGIFGYPLRAATEVALWEAFSFLKRNRDHFDMLVFACFTEPEYDVYAKSIDDIYRRVMIEDTKALAAAAAIPTSVAESE